MLDGGNIGGNVGQGGYGQTSGGDPLGFGYDAYGNPMGTNMSNEVALDIVRAMYAAQGIGQPGYISPYGQTVGTPPTGTNRPGWGVVDMGLMQSAPALAPAVDLIEQSTIDPWGSALLNSESNMGAPTGANLMGDIDGGSDPYIRRKHRLPGFAPDYGAYVDLYEDLVAAQPQGMSKADWGRRHWERHGGQEGRSFYGPSERVLPPRPDGTIGMEFITRPQPPAFNKPPSLPYENAYQNAFDNESGGYW